MFCDNCKKNTNYIRLQSIQDFDHSPAEIFVCVSWKFYYLVCVS